MAYTQLEGQCQSLEEKTPKCHTRPDAKDKVVTKVFLPGGKQVSKYPGNKYKGTQKRHLECELGIQISHFKVPNWYYSPYFSCCYGALN